MNYYMRITQVLALFIVLTFMGCAGGGGGVYYGPSYRHSPWYYHGGYVRDRVHVVSEEEVRALEAIETERALEFSEPAMDMGFGDMGFDAGGFDF